MTLRSPSVPRPHVGTSGWSYPSWRPGFYPSGRSRTSSSGATPSACRASKLNSTGYRIPGRSSSVAGPSRPWHVPVRRQDAGVPAPAGGDVRGACSGCSASGSGRSGSSSPGPATSASSRSRSGRSIRACASAVRLPARVVGRRRAAGECGPDQRRRGEGAVPLPALPRSAVSRRGRSSGSPTTSGAAREPGSESSPTSAMRTSRRPAVRGAAARAPGLADGDARRSRAAPRRRLASSSSVVKKCGPIRRPTSGRKSQMISRALELRVHGRGVGHADDDRPAAPLRLARADDLEPGLVEQAREQLRLPHGVGADPVDADLLDDVVARGRRVEARARSACRSGSATRRPRTRARARSANGLVCACQPTSVGSSVSARSGRT